MHALLIGSGGFFGAVTRFYLGEWLFSANGFPLGTLIVNLSGCFALGWFLAYAKRCNWRKEVNLLVGTGFLGSFTTFSTFSMESIILIENGQGLLAFFYIILTISIGLSLTYSGFRLAERGEAV